MPVNTDILQKHIWRWQPDRIIAVALAALVFVLSFFSLDNNCPWGDDYAAYLSEGIAIAEGRLDEQAELNTMMHLTPLPEKSQGKPLVYVWGYPLVHSLVYKLVGFDRVVYDDLIYYKLVTVFAFASMAGVYYLLCRNSFGRLVSVLLSGILCLNPEFIEAAGNLYNDLLFMSLSVAAVWLAGNCVGEQNAKRRGTKAVLLGVLLWYIYSVRLNGILVLITVFIAFLHAYAKKTEAMVSTALFTLSGFALLYLIFNLIIFPKPSALGSVLDNLSIPWIKEGVTRQFYELSYWFHHVVEVSTHTVFSIISKISLLAHSYEFSMNVSTVLIKTSRVCVYLLMGFSVLGMISELKRTPHLVFFVLVSFIGTSFVNLIQGLRYLYVILPFVLVFTAAGLRTLFKWINLGWIRCTGKIAGSRSKLYSNVGRLILAMYVFAVIFTAAKPIARADVQNVLYPQRDEKTAYSADAVDMYAYIQKNIEKDASIAFFKPRALYLNTGRHGLSPHEPQYEVTDTDYYLHYCETEFLISEDIKDIYELVYENSELALYKKNIQ